MSGVYSPIEKAIVLEESYTDGCKDHQFTLQLGGCLESMPVQCGAKLVDKTTGDYCEASVMKKVKFPLSSVGLDDGYFSGASVAIQGSNNTKAIVRLPH